MWPFPSLHLLILENHSSAPRIEQLSHQQFSSKSIAWESSESPKGLPQVLRIPLHLQYPTGWVRVISNCGKLYDTRLQNSEVTWTLSLHVGTMVVGRSGKHDQRNNHTQERPQSHKNTELRGSTKSPTTTKEENSFFSSFLFATHLS